MANRNKNNAGNTAGSGSNTGPGLSAAEVKRREADAKFANGLIWREFIERQRRSGICDDDLHAALKDQGEWSKEDFEAIDVATLRELRSFLMSRGIYVVPVTGAQITVAEHIARIMQDQELEIWPPNSLRSFTNTTLLESRNEACHAIIGHEKVAVGYRNVAFRPATATPVPSAAAMETPPAQATGNGMPPPPPGLVNAPGQTAGDTASREAQTAQAAGIPLPTVEGSSQANSGSSAAFTEYHDSGSQNAAGAQLAHDQAMAAGVGNASSRGPVNGTGLRQPHGHGPPPQGKGRYIGDDYRQQTDGFDDYGGDYGPQFGGHSYRNDGHFYQNNGHGGPGRGSRPYGPGPAGPGANHGYQPRGYSTPPGRHGYSGQDARTSTTPYPTPQGANQGQQGYYAGEPTDDELAAGGVQYVIPDGEYDSQMLKAVRDLQIHYPKEHKYTGSLDPTSLNYRLEQFLRRCSDARISRDYLLMALPCMMAEGEVSDECAKHRDAGITNWRRIIYRMGLRFETDAVIRNRTNKWLSLTLHDVLREMPGRPLSEAVHGFYVRLTAIQRSLKSEWHSSGALYSRLITAFDKHAGTTRHAATVSVTANSPDELYMRVLEAVQADERALELAGGPTAFLSGSQEQYLADRSFKTSKPRPTFGNKFSANKGRKPFKCWICGKEGCRWSNHTDAEKSANHAEWVARKSGTKEQYLIEIMASEDNWAASESDPRRARWTILA